MDAMHTVSFSTKQSGLNSVKTGLFCGKANIVQWLTSFGTIFKVWLVWKLISRKYYQQL
jgi:hypothetical protein